MSSGGDGMHFTFHAFTSYEILNESLKGNDGKVRRSGGERSERKEWSTVFPPWPPDSQQERPAVADKPARRLRNVCTVYVRAVGLCKLYS